MQHLTTIGKCTQKKKGKKKRKKKKSSGQTKKNQVKIMSLGDIERRLLKTCAKAVTACDILLLNIKNHKEGLRVGGWCACKGILFYYY